uniref:N-alpha-acetyltransferase 40 n=1 Tax=Oryza meridionalis TaxID=40149 RepID=A0A0E0DR11_9ORYZ
MLGSCSDPPPTPQASVKTSFYYQGERGERRERPDQDSETGPASAAIMATAEKKRPRSSSSNGGVGKRPSRKEVNMEGQYGPEWPSEEKVKRREMVAPEARYIFVRQSSNAITTQNIMKQDSRLEFTHEACNEDRLIGFVHYRFVLEEDVPVVYVYELQMESSAQGKGLGKFLMELVELIAFKSQMGAVMLTVQKANNLAMAFYKKLRYVISSTSPSRVDPLIGLEKNYEILCKAFESEAKSILEEGN